MEVEREIKKMTLGHDFGAGASCLKCKDKCEGFELHFWRKICRNCKCGLTDHDVPMNSEENKKVGKLFEDTKYTGLIAKLKTDGVPSYGGNVVTVSLAGPATASLVLPSAAATALPPHASASTAPPHGSPSSAPHHAATSPAPGGPPAPSAARATALPVSVGVAQASVVPVRKDTPIQAVTYEWAPPGASQYLAVRYIELLPPEKRPVAGTEGAAYRRQQMARQLPEHDQDPSMCHELSPAEVKLMQQFVRKYKDEALGVGDIRLPEDMARGDGVGSGGWAGQGEVGSGGRAGAGGVGTGPGVGNAGSHGAGAECGPRAGVGVGVGYGPGVRGIGDGAGAGYGPGAGTAGTGTMGPISMAGTGAGASPLSGPGARGAGVGAGAGAGYGPGAGAGAAYGTGAGAGAGYGPGAGTGAGTGYGPGAAAGYGPGAAAGYGPGTGAGAAHGPGAGAGAGYGPGAGAGAGYGPGAGAGAGYGPGAGAGAGYGPGAGAGAGYGPGAGTGASYGPGAGAGAGYGPGAGAGAGYGPGAGAGYGPGACAGYVPGAGGSGLGSSFGGNGSPGRMGSTTLSGDIGMPRANPAGLPVQSFSCHQCQKPMQQGQPAVYAERAGYDKLWHPACFVCCTCSELLVDMIYFLKKGRLYCGRHYGDSEKPRCGGCDELIFCNEYTQAENQNWHLKHFCCFECDCVLAGETYVMEEDKPVCKPCYMQSHAVRCAACQQPVEPEAQRVSYGEHHWHAEPQCFQCSGCSKCLMGERFMAVQGFLFCSVECKKKKSAA